MGSQKINLHTHTLWCDGKNNAEEMVLSAIEKGFEILGFSGHCIHPASPDFYLPEESWHILPENINAYLDDINSIKEKYADKIQILTGFEADYLESPETGAVIPSKRNYKNFNPDYLIGSVHFVSTPKGIYSVDHTPENVRKSLIELYGNPEEQTLSKEQGKQAVINYFEAERQMLLKGDFDIWGHPDLIRKRNGVIQFFDESEDWYKEQLELTAKTAAKTGVIAEINTGAIYRKVMDDVYPSAHFLALLHKYNIPICINSDAHDTQAIGYAYEYAVQAAKQAGYLELIYPVKNKTVTIELKK